jgi:hypothetical protein
MISPEPYCATHMTSEFLGYTNISKVLQFELMKSRDIKKIPKTRLRTFAITIPYLHTVTHRKLDIAYQPWVRHLGENTIV